MKRTQMNLSRISDDWYELREAVIYYTNETFSTVVMVTYERE